MKEIIGKVSSNSSQFPNLINYQDKQISDKTEIAETFNNFYVSVGRDLASKIPNVNTDFK